MSATIGTATVYIALQHMRDLEGQDQTLVCDFTEAMLWDLIQTGAVGPIVDYVKMFCDVTDGPADVQRIADEINADVDAEVKRLGLTG